jgi:alpha-1,3-mannosyltransferase
LICGRRRYPAGHLYFYSLLYFATDQGRDIRTAQYVFAGLYLVSLAFVVHLFRRAKVRLVLRPGY